MKRQKQWPAVTLFFAAIVLALVARAAPAGASEGPDDTRRERIRAPAGPSPLAKAPEFDVEKNYNMQRGGYVLLGTGFAAIIAGVALIEVDPWGPIGLGGFVTVGVGISLWTAAGFLLGFSRPVHGKMPDQEDHLISAAVAPGGNGLLIGYGTGF